MLGWLEWRWLGVFIAPTTNSTVGEGCCHPIVRVLTVSTVGALSSGGTRQSGAAPDRYCSLSGAPLVAALTSARTILHCSRCMQPLESTVALASRCSTGAPDSPVAHRTVR
jgi:hypothetical protein